MKYQHTMKNCKDVVKDTRASSEKGRESKEVKYC